ncbi:hypothetical protein QTP86_008129 [Hemibagrus guttatus]|nr:hypothetical protein QTP86_008129 [Hemibagrus guttatus]
MRKSGVAEKYVRVVQDMYERSRTVVRCAVGQTEEFNVEVGLHQGSALSPFLFAIVMDQLSEENSNTIMTIINKTEKSTTVTSSRTGRALEMCKKDKRKNLTEYVFKNQLVMITFRMHTVQ